MIYINSKLLIRLINKISSLFKVDIFYRNKYGIKCARHVPISLSHPASSYESSDIIYVDPLSLKYGFDYLKDDFSNTGKSIVGTPHYDLIDCCARGKPEESIYVKYEMQGCLDSREGLIIKDPFQYHTSRFIEAKNNLEKRQTKPIRIYSINGNFYIFDGKHRVALYAYYNEPLIPAIIIPSNLIIPSKPVFLKAGGAYSKQSCLYKELISCVECSK